MAARSRKLSKASATANPSLTEGLAHWAARTSPQRHAPRHCNVTDVNDLAHFVGEIINRLVAGVGLWPAGLAGVAGREVRGLGAYGSLSRGYDPGYLLNTDFVGLPVRASIGGSRLYEEWRTVLTASWAAWCHRDGCGHGDIPVHRRRQGGRRPGYIGVYHLVCQDPSRYQLAGELLGLGGILAKPEVEPAPPPARKPVSLRSGACG